MLGAIAHAAQHAALHDEVSRLEYEHTERPKQERGERPRTRPTRADDEPRRVSVDRLKDEGSPVFQDDPAAGNDVIDAPSELAEPAAEVVGLGGEHRVSRRDVLPFGVNAIGVLDLVTSEALETRIAIEA